MSYKDSAKIPELEFLSLDKKFFFMKVHIEKPDENNDWVEVKDNTEYISSKYYSSNQVFIGNDYMFDHQRKLSFLVDSCQPKDEKHKIYADKNNMYAYYPSEKSIINIKSYFKRFMENTYPDINNIDIR